MMSMKHSILGDVPPKYWIPTHAGHNLFLFCWLRITVKKCKTLEHHLFLVGELIVSFHRYVNLPEGRLHIIMCVSYSMGRKSQTNTHFVLMFHDVVDTAQLLNLPKLVKPVKQHAIVAFSAFPTCAMVNSWTTYHIYPYLWMVITPFSHGCCNP